VWKRSDAHSDSKQGAQHYGRVHDSIFFYTKSDKYVFNTIYNPLPDSTVENWYRYVEEGTVVDTTRLMYPVPEALQKAIRFTNGKA